ncbi:hypothetical protein B0H11DRAFT_1910913 [Mycena galericulata]|nr:hypothetical protein B0H11DRAFT_1910913 [Mycena galericulata]
MPPPRARPAQLGSRPAPSRFEPSRHIDRFGLAPRDPLERPPSDSEVAHSSGESNEWGHTKVAAAHLYAVKEWLYDPGRGWAKTNQEAKHDVEQTMENQASNAKLTSLSEARRSQREVNNKDDAKSARWATQSQPRGVAMRARILHKYGELGFLPAKHVIVDRGSNFGGHGARSQIGSSECDDWGQSGFVKRGDEARGNFALRKTHLEVPEIR